MLSDFQPFSQQFKLHTADAKSDLLVEGKGTVTIRACSSDSVTVIKLMNVLLAPTITFNVISVAQLSAQNPILLQCTDLGIYVYRYEIVQQELQQRTAPESVDGNSNFVDKSSTVRGVNYARPIFTVLRNNQNLYVFPFSIVFVNKIDVHHFQVEFRNNAKIPRTETQVMVWSTFGSDKKRGESNIETAQLKSPQEGEMAESEREQEEYGQLECALIS